MPKPYFLHRGAGNVDLRRKLQNVYYYHRIPVLEVANYAIESSPLLSAGIQIKASQTDGCLAFPYMHPIKEASHIFG